MSANRRFPASVSLVAGLAIGTVTTVAACGSSPPAVAPATTSAAPSATAAPSPPKQPQVSQAVLQNVARCLQAHGVSIPAESATGKEGKALRDAFRALPLPKQHSVFAACGSLLPADLRQTVQQRMTEESSTKP